MPGIFDNIVVRSRPYNLNITFDRSDHLLRGCNRCICVSKLDQPNRKPFVHTFVYNSTREEGGFRIKDQDLSLIDGDGSTIDWNVWIDSNQGIRPRWNSDDAIGGEVLYGIARVLESKIRICRSERSARSQIVVLRTERPSLALGKNPLTFAQGAKDTRTDPGEVQYVACAVALCSCEGSEESEAYCLE